MEMTNYMELLAVNQPWNLILFMAIPMGTAELLVATEFFTLYYEGNKNSAWRKWNHWLSMVLGVYFLFVFAYLADGVVPHLTWRGIFDYIAVGAYLAGVVPLAAIVLLEWRVLGKSYDERARAKVHAAWLVAFLILGHIAMIFGMVNPTLSGWQPSHVHTMQMEQGTHNMQGMGHSAGK